MCVFSCYTTFVWNIAHSKKNSARYYHKCENVFMQSTHYFRYILMNIPLQHFKKIRPMGDELTINHQAWK
jgi:hypothetical protein